MKFFTYRSRPLYALFFLLAWLALGTRVYAQVPPTKHWDNTFGTNANTSEEYLLVTQLPDGNYLAVCASYGGINGDKTVANFDATNNTSDIWITKLDANGSKIWDKAYGTTAGDRCEGIAITPEGGFYLFAQGGTAINNTRTAPSKGSNDFWVIKCDANGSKIWDKVYGGSGNDVLSRGIVTQDGGFLLTGTTRSPISGDKSEAPIGTATNPDAWIIKVDADGVKQWDKTIGSTVSTSPDNPWEAVEVADGFIILATVSGAPSGTVTGADKGNTDIWVTKLNKTTGTLVWQNRIGTSQFDDPFRPAITNDGGILIPILNSAFGISGDKTVNNIGNADYWLVKLSSTGTKVWDKVYGGTGEEIMRGGVLKVSGGYVLYGSSSSPISGDKTGSPIGAFDLWIIKIDEAGTKIWDKTFGSSAYEGAGSDPADAIQAADGSMVFVIKTSATPNTDNDFDRTYKSEGFDDLWILKTKPQVDIAITVSPTTATGNKGEYLNYTVTVTNNGPNLAPDVAVQVPIPNGRTFLSAQPSVGSYDSGTKIWTIGSLADGAVVTMPLTIKVN